MKEFNIEYSKLDAIPAEVKSGISMWDICPNPMIPDVDNFDEEVKAYAIYSCGNISSTAVETVGALVTKLKGKKFKLRSEALEFDQLGAMAYHESDKQKQVFKTSKTWGIAGSQALMTIPKPTYDAHAIACLIYNQSAKDLGLKPFSKLGSMKREISENPELTDAEKIKLIAKLYEDEKSNNKEFREFSDLQPNVRANWANKVHVCLGPTLDEPLRYLVIATPDGAKSPKEVMSNQSKNVDETSRYLTAIITIAHYLDIPIYNLSKDEDKIIVEKIIND